MIETYIISKTLPMDLAMWLYQWVLTVKVSKLRASMATDRIMWLFGDCKKPQDHPLFAWWHEFYWLVAHKTVCGILRHLQIHHGTAHVLRCQKRLQLPSERISWHTSWRSKSGMVWCFLKLHGFPHKFQLQRKCCCEHAGTIVRQWFLFFLWRFLVLLLLWSNDNLHSQTALNW